MEENKTVRKQESEGLKEGVKTRGKKRKNQEIGKGRGEEGNEDRTASCSQFRG